MIGLVGQKGTMTQLYDEKTGAVIPVTAIEVGECVVVGKRTVGRDGYNALQIGQGRPTKRQLTRPVAGVYKRAGVEPKRWLREVRVDNVDAYQVGQKLTVELFAPGDIVTVTGRTRGRGFSGGMRRWGWAGGPDSHGSMSHRRIGSVSSGSSPGRVYPHRTLPGHYGNEKLTVRGLKVVRIDKERGLLYVRGAIPGHRGSEVMVRKG
ncbi:MAG: 50S ribosomal protein L3 [candidate division WOR-3 bacterium]